MPQAAKSKAGVKPAAKSSSSNGPVRKHTYALAAWTAEIREAGWFVTKTCPTFADNKPEWSGPFETVETACLAIARRLAVELADRHTRSIKFHKIAKSDKLHGLKPTTRLCC